MTALTIRQRLDLAHMLAAYCRRTGALAQHLPNRRTLRTETAEAAALAAYALAWPDEAPPVTCYACHVLERISTPATAYRTVTATTPPSSYPVCDRHNGTTYPAAPDAWTHNPVTEARTAAAARVAAKHQARAQLLRHSDRDACTCRPCDRARLTLAHLAEMDA